MRTKERQRIAEQIPWVTRRQISGVCEGFKSGTPLKAIFAMHGKPPVGLDNYRCKNPARWHFKALKKSQVRSGLYCWSHLLHQCLYGDRDEIARTEKWLNAHLPPKEEA